MKTIAISTLRKILEGITAMCPKHGSEHMRVCLECGRTTCDVCEKPCQCWNDE